VPRFNHLPFHPVPPSGGDRILSHSAHPGLSRSGRTLRPSTLQLLPPNLPQANKRPARQPSGGLIAMAIRQGSTSRANPPRRVSRGAPALPSEAKKRPWPPWRLIATHANSKIRLTRSKKRLSRFLIATQTSVPPLSNCRCFGFSVANLHQQWPRRTARVRIVSRLLLLKLLLGDISGLQDRACSLFYLAGPK